MNRVFRVVSVASALICWTVPVRAEDKPCSAASNDAFTFSHFLKYRPLEFGQLLGKHFGQVVPGASWDGLPVPEEFKNRAVKYGVFARAEGLHDCMRNWDFMTDDYCVSNYSMFLLFFNRGYVFKVELRYIPDSFTGVMKSNDPKFCADETAIFNMIARKLGGSIITRPGSYELTQYTSAYVMKLATGGRTTDLSWDLRGGPSLQKF
jgi:hypothetical protein